jgi:hypothetical protein
LLPKSGTKQKITSDPWAPLNAKNKHLTPSSAPTQVIRAL